MQFRIYKNHQPTNYLEHAKTAHDALMNYRALVQDQVTALQKIKSPYHYRCVIGYWCEAGFVYALRNKKGD
jgi:hypothetical protein